MIRPKDAKELLFRMLKENFVYLTVRSVDINNEVDVFTSLGDKTQPMQVHCILTSILPYRKIHPDHLDPAVISPK